MDFSTKKIILALFGAVAVVLIITSILLVSFPKEEKPVKTTMEASITASSIKPPEEKNSDKPAAPAPPVTVIESTETKEPAKEKVDTPIETPNPPPATEENKPEPVIKDPLDTVQVDPPKPVVDDPSEPIEKENIDKVLNVNNETKPIESPRTVVKDLSETLEKEKPKTDVEPPSVIIEKTDPPSVAKDLSEAVEEGKIKDEKTPEQVVNSKLQVTPIFGTSNSGVKVTSVSDNEHASIPAAKPVDDFDKKEKKVTAVNPETSFHTENAVKSELEVIPKTATSTSGDKATSGIGSELASKSSAESVGNSGAETVASSTKSQTDLNPSIASNTDIKASTTPKVEADAPKPASIESPVASTLNAKDVTPSPKNSESAVPDKKEVVEVKNHVEEACGEDNSVFCGTFDIVLDSVAKYRVFYAKQQKEDVTKLIESVKKAEAKSFNLRIFEAKSEETIEGSVYHQTEIIDENDDDFDPKILGPSVQTTLEGIRKSGFLGFYNNLDGASASAWNGNDIVFIAPGDKDLKLFNAEKLDTSKFSSSESSTDTEFTNLYNQEITKGMGFLTYKYRIMAHRIEKVFQQPGLQAVHIEFIPEAQYKKRQEEHGQIYNEFIKTNGTLRHSAYNGLNVFYNYGRKDRDIIHILDTIAKDGAKKEFNQQYGYGLGTFYPFNVLLIGPSEKLADFTKFE